MERVRRVRAEMPGKLPLIFHLLNNAGIIRDQLLMSMSDADWRDVIDTNLTGAFVALKSVIPLMVRRRKGSVVNISSIAGSRPGKGHCNYAASKGGLEAMTKALLEWETIDSDQIGDIMEGKPPRPPKPSGSSQKPSRPASDGCAQGETAPAPSA